MYDAVGVRYVSAQVAFWAVISASPPNQEHPDRL